MNSPSELPEFLAALSNATTPDAALREGVARIAEAFDAEVAAFVHDHEIIASVGYPRGATHHAQLLAAADGATDVITVPGVGIAPAASVTVDHDSSAVVIARSGAPLDRSERTHAHAMGRVLDLTMQLLRTVNRERDLRQLTEQQIVENERLLAGQRSHQQILEAILRVQRLISQRRPIDSILRAITREAATILNVDLAGIRIAAPGGISQSALSAGSDAGRALAAALTDGALDPIAQHATNGLAEARPFMVDLQDGSVVPVNVVGAPVLDSGAPIGGLYLLSTDQSDPGQTVTSAPLHTFASQASIALTDASTLDELHHAFHDTLTGLPNRALFLDRLEHALALGQRQRTTTALLFLDLDRFKAVNDTLGHAAGDDLLRQIGERLSAGSRAFDSAARLGGDEFAVLFGDTTREEVTAIANRLLHAVERIAGPSGSPGRYSASIGIALAGPDCRSGDELLRRADIAMYSVKAKGRAGVAVYESAMGRSRLDHGAMAAALRRALTRDEFIVFYQPIVNLRNRQLTGVEALVRWHDPARGLIAPDQFVQIAEDTGMIVPIGRRVLRKASEQVAHWRRTIPAASDLTVNVNLSGRQLDHDDVLDDVHTVLNDSGLDVGALTLEVTESVFVADAAASGERLRALKELGVGLAIDDFGTGFSSLSYVQHYPFDVLKIDRSFVRAVSDGPNGGAVVKTMLALAQQLSMTTVAEGIERPVELAQLRALRCTHGQGFLFSRPVEAHRLQRLLIEGLRPIAVDSVTPTVRPTVLDGAAELVGDELASSAAGEQAVQTERSPTAVSHGTIRSWVPRST